MGFNVSFGKTGGQPLTQKFNTWIITSEGRRVLENYSGPDYPKIKVLMTLQTLGGNANVEEISQYAKTGKDTVEFQLRQLAQSGLVRQRKSVEDANPELPQ